MNRIARSTRIKRRRIATRIVAGGRQRGWVGMCLGSVAFELFSQLGPPAISPHAAEQRGGSRRQPAMVRAKSYSKRSGSRHRGSYAAPASHGSSKMSTTPSSPRGRGSSIGSLHSRASSYDSLRLPSKDSDMSRNRPPHYGRMVFDAVARLKNRRGATIKDITKNLGRQYPYVLKLGSNGTEKVIATAKKLVKEGKLVKDGSNYFLSKTSSRKSEDTDDNSSQTSHRNLKTRNSGEKHRHSHRGRSHSRGRGRPRNSSRSRSRGKRSRSYSRSRSRSRKVRRYNNRKQRKGRNRYASTRRSLKRGSKRKKKGTRKGQTRLATGRRRAHQKKIARARRRVKHTYTRRPKSDKLPDGDSSQNKGWFGGWFGGKGGGDAKQQGHDKGSSSKSEKRSKSTQDRSTGGEREIGGV